MNKKALISFALLGFVNAALAGDITVLMQNLKTQKSLGTVTLSQTAYGTVLTPNLKGLSPGLHGFHLHTNDSCASALKGGKMTLGAAAGGHYDPKKTNKHGTPWDNHAHLGDLPALFVDHSGVASHPVLAPRLKLADLKGRSLMIHAGSDNYSDHPKALGGGGARAACGVIP